MTDSRTPSTPCLNYHAPELWGDGVQLSLLDMGSRAGVFPFKASRFVLAPGAMSPIDEHTVAEIWMTARGSGRLLYGDAAYDMSPGDVFYIQPRVKHHAVNTSDQPLEIFSVWWSQ